MRRAINSINKNDRSDTFYLCPFCNEKFDTYGTIEWGYKRRNFKGQVMFFCGYNCLVKYDKEQARKRRNRNGDMKNEKENV